MAKNIVIAPIGAQRVLFDLLRKNDPFVDLKFLSKEQLLKSFYYQYGDDAIKYLISKYSLSLQLAKSKLSFIPYSLSYNGDSKRILELKSIGEELLDKGFLVKDDLFVHELKNAKIKIYCYSELDCTINKLLQGYDFEFVNLPMHEFPLINSFLNNEEQMVYVVNEIASLLNSGVKANKIFISGLLEKDELFLHRLAKHIGINFENYCKTTFNEIPLSKHFFKFLENLQDIDKAIELLKDNFKNDEYLDEFISIINEYSFDSLSLDNQTKLFHEVLNNKAIDRDRYLEAIRIIDEPIVKDDEFLFMINFNEGIYPRLKRDEDYLDDKEKRILGLATSKEENIALNDYYACLLKTSKNMFVSYIKRDEKGKARPSSFVSSLKLKTNDLRYPQVFYSNNEVKLIATHQKDLSRKFLVDDEYTKLFSAVPIDYQTYDPQIKPINHIFKDLPLKLSYSQTKDFYMCPYAYYLKHIIHIDPKEDSFSLIFGLLSHDVYEDAGTLKSFDEIYEEKIKKYQDKIDDRGSVFLLRLKEEMRKVFAFIQKFEKQITNPYIKREHRIQNLLNDKTMLEGRMDKIILSGDKQDNISIVDYKTSDHEFFKEKLVDYGLSLQLPVYALLCQNDPFFKDKQMLGIYIQNTLADESINKLSISENEYYKQLRLKGKTLDNISRIETLSKVNKPASEYIASLALKNDNTISSKGDPVRNKDWFIAMANKAKQLIIDASFNIQAGNFYIKPKMYKGDLISCTYCNFRDICYRRKEMTIILENEEDEGEED